MNRILYLLIFFVQVLMAEKNYYFSQITFDCNLITTSELSELEASKKYLEEKINLNDYTETTEKVNLSEFNCLSKTLNIKMKTAHKILNLKSKNNKFKELFILNEKYVISIGDDFYIIFDDKSLNKKIKQLIKNSSDNDSINSKEILKNKEKEFKKDIATHKALTLNDFYQDIELLKYKCQNNDFNPKKNNPTTNELFLYQIANNLCLKESLDKYSEFNQKNILNIPQKTKLYKTASEESITKMYLIAGDKADLLEETTDEKGVKWYNILYHGNKKDINAWIKADENLKLETKNK